MANVEFDSILKFGMVLVIVFLLYKSYLANKKVEVKMNVPKRRKNPLVITEVGLCEPKSWHPLADGKFLVKYRHQHGYTGIYYKNDKYSDLIDIDNHHNLLGSKQPVMIERKVLLELAYGHEQARIRDHFSNLLEKTLQSLDGGEVSQIDRENFERIIQGAIKKLQEKPKGVKEILDQLQETTDESARRKSKILKQEVGTDGKIDRKIDQLIDVVSRRASPGEKNTAS